MDRPRVGALSVFGLLLLTYAGFFQAATWGAAGRFDLARALAERGTIVIDAYHENTGDKASFEGRYYSDKAPLPSFLAAPGVALGHAIRRATGLPLRNSVWLAMTAGIAVILASGLPTALGGAAFFRALRERDVGPDAAWWTTVFVFLGTTIFPYATVLQGHAPAAAWLVIFFAAALPGRGAPGRGRTLLAGAAASAALATEYLTGPPLVILAAASLLRDRPGALRRAAGFALGAAPGLVLLGLYHHAAFGSPFALGYQHVALPFFQEKMSRGLFGIGAPDPVVAARLLFGSYRGLFFACPVLLVAAAGLIELGSRRERRIEAIAAGLVFLFYLTLNAGYSTWHGGWAIGPRHLVPAVPFLGLGLVPALARRPRLTGAAGALSILFMLAVTSVQPEVPEEIAHPIFGHALPRFVRGELSVGEQGFDDLYPARLDPATPDRWDAFLLGEAIGLPGLAALLPTLFAWAALSPPGLAALRRRRRGPPPKNGP
jgi:hypothetical protein